MSTVAARRAAPRATLARLLPPRMWAREWLVTVAASRSLALRVAMPLLLTVPLIAGGAPTFWAAMLLTVLVAMVGAVGSGVSLTRARSAGFLARLAVLPRSPGALVGEWVAAAAAVDAVQLSPAVAVVALGGGGGPAAAAALAAMVVSVLLLANALGCALAVLARGTGEVLLDAVVVLSPLLFLGGLFTGVPRTGWRLWAARVDPFGALHSAFIGALGGDPAFGGGTILVVAAATAAVAGGALLLLGRPLLERT